jgi:hypothetical protein
LARKLHKTPAKGPAIIGSQLEDMMEREAERNGWIVQKRKRFGDRVIDLVLEQRRRGVIMVLQAKNTVATPMDVTQAYKDYLAYMEWLIQDRLGVVVLPVLLAKNFSPGVTKRAAKYDVRAYKLQEFLDLLHRLG